jgi:hypothetical protein
VIGKQIEIAMIEGIGAGARIERVKETQRREKIGIVEEQTAGIETDGIKRADVIGNPEAEVKVERRDTATEIEQEKKIEIGIELEIEIEIEIEIEVEVEIEIEIQTETETETETEILLIVTTNTETGNITGNVIGLIMVRV